MAVFYYDTSSKLREIFAEHCNLSLEQYEEINGQFLYLVTDHQKCEPMVEIDKRVQYMVAVFEFLMNTKELTLKEYTDLMAMIGEIEEKARKEKVKLAMEGKVL